MREILFRGKRMDNGELVFGDLIREPWGYCIQVVTGSGNGYSRKKYAITEETVGQYTGLKDKNGKRIFEGDILSIWNDRNDVVVYEDGAFIMEDTEIPMRFAIKFEVIGNIHDNPELLEK